MLKLASIAKIIVAGLAVTALAIGTASPSRADDSDIGTGLAIVGMVTMGAIIAHQHEREADGRWHQLQREDDGIHMQEAIGGWNRGIQVAHDCVTSQKLFELIKLELENLDRDRTMAAPKNIITADEEQLRRNEYWYHKAVSDCS